MRIPLLATLFLLTTLCGMPRVSHAAQSYDNCSGYIDSVPAVIVAQGTWCLRKDLSTAQTSGNAIEIAANNVILDCNDFKLGGLAAGSSSQAVGIHAEDQQNVTVRHCNVRGFNFGIFLTGEGLLVEDNRLDSNLYTSVYVDGDRNLVRRNRIYATGGWNGEASAFGMLAKADIIDNIVDGVSTVTATTVLYGIASWGSDGTRISGNRIAGLAPTGDTGKAIGIHTLHSTHLAITGNRIVASVPGTDGLGISSDSSNSCGGNTVANFVAAIEIDPCTDIGGNDRL